MNSCPDPQGALGGFTLQSCPTVHFEVRGLLYSYTSWALVADHQAKVGGCREVAGVTQVSGNDSSHIQQVENGCMN